MLNLFIPTAFLYKNQNFHVFWSIDAFKVSEVAYKKFSTKKVRI